MYLSTKLYLEFTQNIDVGTFLLNWKISTFSTNLDFKKDKSSILKPNKEKVFNIEFKQKVFIGGYWQI